MNCNTAAGVKVIGIQAKLDKTSCNKTKLLDDHVKVGEGVDRFVIGSYGSFPFEDLRYCLRMFLFQTVMLNKLVSRCNPRYACSCAFSTPPKSIIFLLPYVLHEVRWRMCASAYCYSVY